MHVHTHSYMYTSCILLMTITILRTVAEHLFSLTIIVPDIKQFGDQPCMCAINSTSETSEQRTHWGQDSCPLYIER